MIFFTSDLHFDHDNIRIHCNRPFATIEAMNAVIASRWNERISKKDEVYIVGDFAWKRHGHWIQALNGKKHLIRGNHDKMAEVHLRCFTSVEQIKQITIDKKLLILCHYPMRSWNGRCYGSMHFFGHVHGRLNNRLLFRTVDVGVDSHDFYPWEWSEVLAVVQAQLDPHEREEQEV